MPIEHEFETSITVMGTEIPVTAIYVITSHGSADSLLEPGDPVEIEVIKVIDRKGDDISDWCNKHHDYDNKNYKPWFGIVLEGSEKRIDPIRNILFGFFYSDYQYVTKFKLYGYSYLDTIHDAIYQSDAINDAITSEDNMAHDYD